MKYNPQENFCNFALTHFRSSQVRQDSEQLDLVEAVPVLCRGGVGLDDL